MIDELGGAVMTAAVVRRFGDPGVLRLEEVARPSIAEHELLVRVKACGVCGHDVLARRGELGGSLPRILGHEIVGEVVEAGPAVRRIQVGSRVVLNQRRSCGSCTECATGNPNRCTSGAGFYGEDIPGGYAEFVSAGEQNAVVLPAEIDDVDAAALPCGVCTGLHALARAGAGLGDTIVVTGAGGGVGLNAVSLAHLAGGRVIGVTHSPDKADAVREAGADQVVVADADTFAEAVREIAPGGADVVVECVGTPALPASLHAVRRGGVVALVGNVRPSELGPQVGLVILKELRIVGSSHGTPRELAAAVRLVASGRLAPRIAAVYELDRVAEAHCLVEAGAAAGRVIVQVP